MLKNLFSIAQAFLLGFFDHIGSDGNNDMGRTHPTDQDWNEAYDHGWNLADRITRRK